MLRRRGLLLMRLVRSTRGDVPDVQAILQAAGLPLIGVGAAFRTGVVAHDGDAVVGAAAMEPYGPSGCSDPSWYGQNASERVSAGR